MPHVRRRLSLNFAALLVIAPVARAADLPLSSLFGDGMVLQRDAACPVWGTATPNATVEARIGGKPVATATADAKGAFELRLPKLAAPGPYEIELRTTDGTMTTTLHDVLAGDVWLCSGQSNMQWRVQDAKDGAAEVANAKHPTIRLYHVPRLSTAAPLSQPDAHWAPCTPETIGDFSAVAYFFGRELNAKLDVPIGLIHSSYGGTPAESWTPLATLRTLKDLPQVQTIVARADRDTSPESIATFARETKRWMRDTGHDDPDIADVAWPWSMPEFDDASWKTMKVPADATKQGVASGSIMWFRKHVTVPADLIDRPATLELSLIDDFDQTFVNGHRVGATGLESPPWELTPRVYRVPAGILLAGDNVVSVRVVDLGNRAGLVGNAQAMRLVADAPSGTVPAIVPLAGDWRYAVERDGPTTKPATAAAATTQPLRRPSPPLLPDNPQFPGGLYNAMIAPLHDYAIRGAIWYQGESNANRAAEYAPLMTTMIRTWRDQFGQGDFPFYVVGLANWRDATTQPAQVSEWGGIREAQRELSHTVKNIATTVTIDIGDAIDIHPKDKQTVGRRLANVALEETYGKAGLPRSPTLKSVARGPGEHELTLTFDRAGGGLVVRGETLTSFSVAGSDGTFVWADARIDGADRVIVSAPQVDRPTVVRYAYADNPQPSLFNKDGEPAEPFEQAVK